MNKQTLEDGKKLLENEDQLDLYLSLVASAPLEHFQDACERFKNEYLNPLLAAQERVVRSECLELLKDEILKYEFHGRHYVIEQIQKRINNPTKQ